MCSGLTMWRQAQAIQEFALERYGSIGPRTCCRKWNDDQAGGVSDEENK